MVRLCLKAYEIGQLLSWPINATNVYNYDFFVRKPKRQNEGPMPQHLRPERERHCFSSFVLVDIFACKTIELIRSLLEQIFLLNFLATFPFANQTITNASS